jgi:hypothetical protein
MLRVPPQSMPGDPQPPVPPSRLGPKPSLPNCHRLLLTVWTAAATAAIFSLAASPAAVAASTTPARPIAENVVPGESAPPVVDSDTTWSASSSCYYPNYTAAHQDGEGNIPSNSSHYCSKQDRDGDGIACEW